MLLGHHGYPRASDLIRVKALKGRKCHQITDATVRPFSPSPQSNSQTSAGTLRIRKLLTLAIHFERSLDRSSHARLRRCRLNSRLDAGLIATSLRQDGPSDPRQLVGERNCQNIAMHAPRSRREPRSKTVPRPARRMEQGGAAAIKQSDEDFSHLASGPPERPGIGTIAPAEAI